jgi:hypothetical protein
MSMAAHQIYLVVLLSFCTSVCLANSPNSILRQFAESETQQNTEIIWVDTDINGDGINDLLVTTTNHKQEDDPRDFEWAVYAGNTDGTYSRCTTSLGQIQQLSLSMRLDRYWVGYIPEINRHGLLHLTCGTGGQAMCQFNALVLDKSTFTNLPIGTPVNAEENFEAYKQRIQSKGHPETSKATYAQVKQLQTSTRVSPKEPATTHTEPITTSAIVQPPAPKKAPSPTTAQSPPSEEPASSTPWSIIAVLIVAATGLLWLLLKGRK